MGRRYKVYDSQTEAIERLLFRSYNQELIGQTKLKHFKEFKDRMIFCNICGIGKVKLHRHRIIPGGVYSDENVEVVCVKCHKLIHYFINELSGRDNKFRFAIFLAQDAKRKEYLEMSSNKAKRHIHKYHRIPMFSSKVWACALPDCNHYMPKHMEPMIKGKGTYCWECGDEMILIGKALEMDLPKCPKCQNPELNKMIEEIENKEILSVIKSNNNVENENKKQSMEEFLKSIGVK